MSTWYYPKNVEDVTAFLKHRREQLGYSMCELERLSGVTEATISRVEQDLHCPRLSTVDKLLTALEVSAAYCVHRGPRGPPLGYCHLADVPRSCRRKRTSSARAIAAVAGCDHKVVLELEAGADLRFRIYAAITRALGFAPIACRL